MKDEDKDGALSDSKDAWALWRSFTSARIGLGRVGNAVPTAEALGFGLAHALARDAIHTPLDVAALASELNAQDWPALPVKSRAPDRETYLRRPDLGRRLDADDRVRLDGMRGEGCDLAVVIDEAVPAQALIDAVRQAAGPGLSALRLFDVYRGQGLREGSKSVALGLIFQDYSRTLTVEDIDAATARVTSALARDLGAVLRE